MKTKRYYLVFVICILCFQLKAQEHNSFNLSSNRFGFLIGYGSQDIGPLNLDVDYEYDVLVFQPQFFFMLLQRQDHGLELVLQPQFNISRFMYQDYVITKSNGNEFGLNIGLLFRYIFPKESTSLYVLGSSGPHSVSDTPQRQANGFMFSSQFSLGAQFKTSKNSLLDIRSSLRHLSNLAREKPNRGINNLIISAGIMVNL